MNTKIFNLIKQNLEQSFNLPKYKNVVIDADTVITRKIHPIANGNAKFYMNQNEQNFKPYFNFAKNSTGHRAMTISPSHATSSDYPRNY